MIASLTQQQWATCASHAQQWVDRDLACGPLAAQHRDEVVRGLRGCYAAAGLPWPGAVVWVSSPAVGELAARAAAATVRARGDAAVVAARPRRAALTAGLLRAGRTARGFLTVATATVAVSIVALWCCGGSMRQLLDGTVSGGLGDMLLRGVLVVPAVLGALGGFAVSLGHWREHVAAIHLAAAERLSDAAAADVNAAGERIRASTVGPARSAVAAAHSGALGDQLRERVERPVDAAEVPVWIAVRTGLRQGNDAGNRRVRAAALRALRQAVGPDGMLIAPTDPRDAVSGRVREVEAVHSDGELAALLWWRRHGGVALPRGLGAGLEAFADASRVWWWAHPDFVIACEPPVEMHLERAETGTVRPHRDDGPAIRWSDGAGFCFWHGVQVPASLMAGLWNVETIHLHPNSEVRRAAIERMGWLAYIRQAGLRVVASVPDPGNPPHELVLYEDPRGRLGDARVLVMTNGSPDRSGEIRRYAEAVPGDIDDPVTAAAWQYGCPVEVYRGLQRRT